MIDSIVKLEKKIYIFIKFLCIIHRKIKHKLYFEALYTYLMILKENLSFILNWKIIQLFHLSFNFFFFFLIHNQIIKFWKRSILYNNKIRNTTVWNNNIENKGTKREWYCLAESASRNMWEGSIGLKYVSGRARAGGAKLLRYIKRYSSMPTVPHLASYWWLFFWSEQSWGYCTPMLVNVFMERTCFMEFVIFSCGTKKMIISLIYETNWKINGKFIGPDIFNQNLNK